MTSKFDQLHEGIMGSLRKMAAKAGLGEVAELRKRWSELKKHALQLVNAREVDWQHVNQPIGQPLNWRIGPNRLEDFTGARINKLKEIKQEMDKLKKRVMSLGLNHWELN